jgi:hypothetical protein
LLAASVRMQEGRVLARHHTTDGQVLLLEQRQLQHHRLVRGAECHPDGEVDLVDFCQLGPKVTQPFDQPGVCFSSPGDLLKKKYESNI